MPSSKIIKIFFYIILLSVTSSFFISDITWRKNLLKDNNPVFPYPLPYYGLHLVPGTAAKPGNFDALGEDFSQVYFAAKALQHGESAYNPSTPEFRDHFGRLTTYPPHIIWLYTSIASKKYYKALQIHNFGTLILFFIITIIICKHFSLSVYSGKFILIYILLYFYTTLGFTHFERGQFDFYTAIGILLLYSSIFSENHAISFAALSGFFFSLKWASFPFVFSFSLFAFFANPSKRKWVYTIPVIVIFLTIAAFFREIKEFIPSLKMFEFYQKDPYGISFMMFMPKILAKHLQQACAVLITLIFYLFVPKEEKTDRFRTVSFPFAFAMNLQGLCYGTHSWEYRVISILGFIPALAIWIHNTNLSSRFKCFVTVSMGLFIIIAFRTFYFLFWDEGEWQSVPMSVFYLVSSIYFLIICTLIIIKPGLFKQDKNNNGDSKT